jgi:hypothetical protein
MLKFFTLLVFGFSALFLLCGCGVYEREYSSFESTRRPSWNADSIREYCTITPNQFRKRILVFYWSDVYSEPYRLDFVVESNQQKDSAVRVHEVVLYLHGKAIVLHSKDSDPIEKKFSRKKEYQSYETLFDFDLEDYLQFAEDLEFETVVSWSLSDDSEVRELKTKFKAVKSSDKSSIWSAMQGI